MCIRDRFESEKYMRYLSVMSKFHRYSVNNTMLIYMQRPDATLVAGFNKWKNQFERHVKKGEHGITIIAPTPYKKKIEEMKRDPDTHAPILDADGKAVMEEKEIEIPMFRPVKVFDVSQTDGKPLPELASSLSGTVPQDVYKRQPPTRRMILSWWRWRPTTLPKKRRCKPRSTTSKAAIRGMTSTAMTWI